MSWEAPRNIRISVYFQLRLKKRPGPTPGRHQGGSGCLPGTSPASFWIDFGLIFQVDSHTHRIPSEVASNSKKMRRGHKSLTGLSQRLPGCCCGCNPVCSLGLDLFSYASRAGHTLKSLRHPWCDNACRMQIPCNLND